MDFSRLFFNDLFLHFPGMIGVFDINTGIFLWGNDNWRERYSSYNKGKTVDLTSLVNPVIYPGDRVLFMNSFERVATGGDDSVTFLIRLQNHHPKISWICNSFRRIEATDHGSDLVCCHQMSLDDLPDANQVRDFYHNFRKNHQSPSIQSLTTRELEILKLIAQGHSYTTIAEHLFIQPETVNRHRKNIEKKLNLNSIAMLTCFAIENGLVDT